LADAIGAGVDMNVEVGFQSDGAAEGRQLKRATHDAIGSVGRDGGARA
jgi:hypothetical protein